jgi:hypothetical protein
VRQVLGVAAIRNVEHIRLLERKQDLTLELTKLFSPLFPTKAWSSSGLFDIVDTAVDLRNDITKEFAIYSCFWFSADCKIDLDLGLCEFDGWCDERPFLLCISPGFSQSIKLHDGSIKELCLKQARIEMEW